MSNYNKQIKDILNFMMKINIQNFSEKDIERIFLAMLTPSEIEVICQRIHVLKLLHSGNSQRDVSEQLGVGVATATRGNRMLKENIDLFKKILTTDK